MLKDCRSLRKLFVSVNKFDDHLGWSIIERLQQTLSLVELDIRNSSLSATTTMLIDEIINRNLINSLEENEQFVSNESF